MERGMVEHCWRRCVVHTKGVTTRTLYVKKEYTLYMSTSFGIVNITQLQLSIIISRLNCLLLLYDTILSIILSADFLADSSLLQILTAITIHVHKPRLQADESNYY